MSKRVAPTVLNQDNWDHEQDKEDAGVFTAATSEEMKNRKVKVAKRRCPQSESQSALAGGGGGTFSNFNFIPNTPKTPSPNFNFIQLPKTSTDKLVTENIGVNGKMSTIFSLSTKTEEKPAVECNTTNDATQSPSAFLHGLKSLNEAVVKWITMHVQQTPHCLLSPIFKDYDNYVSDLESKYPDSMVVFTHSPKRSRSSTNLLQSDLEEPVEVSKNVPSVSSLEKTLSLVKHDVIPFSSIQSISSVSSKSSSNTTINFFSNTNEKEKKGVEIKESPSFIYDDDDDEGKKEKQIPKVTSKFFSRESLATGATSTSGLFGGLQPKTEPAKFSLDSGSRPFSFAVAATESEQPASTDDNETEYIPPKVEVTPVVEEDSLFSVKCKLFFTRDNQYIEKGVGMLHIKKLSDEKRQLFIRQDTNIGNILLNIVLNDSVATKRKGNNNIILCCVPNPPLEPKTVTEQNATTPVPLLIRVKTSEEAEELLNCINKYKS